jgi:hypothetical protein
MIATHWAKFETMNSPFKDGGRHLEMFQRIWCRAQPVSVFQQAVNASRMQMVHQHCRRLPVGIIICRIFPSGEWYQGAVSKPIADLAEEL